MWTNKIKLLLIASVSISVFATSCTKDFGTTNVDPNQPTSPYSPALLTNTIAGMGSNLGWDQGGFNTQQGLYAQYFSETQYTETSNYAKPNNNWDGYYAGPLKDLQVIIDYNSDPATATAAAAYGSNNNQIAIARILKAYYFWFLTDTYGDIPYKGIFNVADAGQVAFTPQSEIYDSLFAELDAAIKQFDPSGVMAQGDILFNPSSNGSQITSWTHLANSMRALMALRLSKVDAAKGKAQFNAALDPANGGVIEEGQNVNLSYPGGNFPSPFYNYINVTKRDDYGISDVLVDFLAHEGDDRIYAFSRNINFATNPQVIGFPYGLTRDEAIAFTNANANYSRPVGSSTSIFTDGTNFIGETAPITLIGSAEIYLARAEAAHLGWTNESVEDNYYTGIKENYKQWDVYAGNIQPDLGGGAMDGDDYELYINQDDIMLKGDADDYSKIGTQEWLAHYPKGWFGWADWRRTGFPDLTPSSNSTYKKIPLRVPYGLNEFNLDANNVSSAASSYTGADGTNSMYAPLWWDK